MISLFGRAAIASALVAVVVTGPVNLLGPSRSAFAAEPPAAASSVDSLLVRLDKASQSVTSLRGEFEQKSRVKLFKQELTSRGQFAFARPRRIRWEYVSPDPSVLIVDGDKAQLIMPGSAPQTFDLAKDATMRTVFDQLSAWLGAGPAGSVTKLGDQYDLAASGTADAPVLTLTPKAGSTVAKAFARIELRFDKELLLRSILLREASGDEKEITFKKLERNAKLPDNTFRP